MPKIHGAAVWPGAEPDENAEISPVAPACVNRAARVHGKCLRDCVRREERRILERRGSGVELRQKLASAGSYRRDCGRKVDGHCCSRCPNITAGIDRDRLRGVRRRPAQVRRPHHGASTRVEFSHEGVGPRHERRSCRVAGRVLKDARSHWKRRIGGGTGDIRISRSVRGNSGDEVGGNRANSRLGLPCPQVRHVNHPSSGSVHLRDKKRRSPVRPAHLSWWVAQNHWCFLRYMHCPTGPRR